MPISRRTSGCWISGEVRTRDLVWRTPGGSGCVRSSRLVSLARHLAMLTFEVTVLDGAAPLVISSQLLNRQDGEDEYHVAAAALGHGRDPRKMRAFDHRVLVPRLHYDHDGEVVLGYRCANSGTLACAYRHIIETAVETAVRPDLAKTVITARVEPGQMIRRQARLVPRRPGCRPRSSPIAATARLTAPSRTARRSSPSSEHGWTTSGSAATWSCSATTPVNRWNLFQLAQASAQTQEQGIAAKGVTGGGYEGHYFWDTETYVVPFLAYTSPDMARKVMRFRWRQLDKARLRAQEVNQVRAVPMADDQRRRGVGLRRRGPRSTTSMPPSPSP